MRKLGNTKKATVGTVANEEKEKKNQLENELSDKTLKSYLVKFPHKPLPAHSAGTPPSNSQIPNSFFHSHSRTLDRNTPTL